MHLEVRPGHSLSDATGVTGCFRSYIRHPHPGDLAGSDQDPTCVQLAGPKSTKRSFPPSIPPSLPPSVRPSGQLACSDAVRSSTDSVFSPPRSSAQPREIRGISDTF
ncbi:hypothetical protein SRHO_G00314140 [Serrasalmus rhombeus]